MTETVGGEKSWVSPEVAKRPEGTRQDMIFKCQIYTGKEIWDFEEMWDFAHLNRAITMSLWKEFVSN